MDQDNRWAVAHLMHGQLYVAGIDDSGSGKIVGHRSSYVGVRGRGQGSDPFSSMKMIRDIDYPKEKGSDPFFFFLVFYRRRS